MDITLVEWFHNNCLTLNADKCHLLASGYKSEVLFAEVSDATIWDKNRKILALLIDSGLNFDNGNMICGSLFNCSPLIWMFYDRACNQMINKLHERTLEFAYNDYCSIFVELLDKNRSVTIHQRNLKSVSDYNV